MLELKHLFIRGMSDLSNTTLWQHKAGRLCHLPGVRWNDCENNDRVSNARKGGSEQWVRRKKQIKRAREITAFRSLCIWKKME